MHEPLLVGPFGGSISQECLHSEEVSTGACSATSAAIATLDFATALAGFAAVLAVFTVAFAVFAFAAVPATDVLDPAFAFDAALPVAVTGFFVGNGRSSQRLTPPGWREDQNNRPVGAASGAKKEAHCHAVRPLWDQQFIVPDTAFKGSSTNQHKESYAIRERLAAW